MSDEIVIETGARLHFGLLANSPALPRQFGGAGLMISGVGFRIHGRLAGVDAVTGDDSANSRAVQFLKAYRELAPQDLQPPPYSLEITQTIPAHIGLGSGTQLGMAVAKALSTLAGFPNLPAVELAGYTGRGLRSGLGVHGFEAGGFLVDGGKSDKASLAPLVSRIAFPEDWRFLLVRPSETHGLSGECELEAFAKIEPMPPETTQLLCQLLLLQILPAVAEADFDACGDGLYEFGQVVGRYFAPRQGGVLASAEMRKLAATLRRDGHWGVGQTSWGPTLFVLCPDQERAEALRSELAKTARWSDCQFNLVQPMNTGAHVSVR